jgi:hypothetical protein
MDEKHNKDTMVSKETLLLIPKGRSAIRDILLIQVNHITQTV